MQIQPLQYEQHGRKNPADTMRTALGTLGYLIVGTLAIPCVWLFGVSGIIQHVWNLNTLRLAEQKKEQLNRFIATLKGRISKLEPSSKEAKEIDVLICESQGKINEIDPYIKRRYQTLTAAKLALIPVIGLILVGIYLKKTTHNIHETGLRGAVEAIAQKLFAGSQFVNKSLFALQGLSEKSFEKRLGFYAEMLREEITKMNGTFQKIKVDRGFFHNQDSIQVITIPAKDEKEFDPKKATMVVFHGNGETALTKAHHAKFYQQRGYQVVLVTLGGYPGSDSAVKTCETSSIQDAHAVITFLKNQGCKTIGVHGTSLGGTSAFAAAELHPDVVKVIIPDQTFDKGSNVAVNLLRNIFGRFAPADVIRGAIKGGMPEGEIVPGVYTLDGKAYKTDGLNNLRKAAVIKAEMFAIRTTKDHFMGRGKRDRNGFEHNFADDLIIARYGKQGQLDLNKHSLSLHAGHCAWFNHMPNGDQLSAPLTSWLQAHFK